RAVALLHSFGYEEARRAFEDVAAADPACAIAHWGVAMTWYHPIWAPPYAEELKQGAAAIERAATIPARTARENDFIQALAVFYKDWQTRDHTTRATAYENAMAQLHAHYPGDDEATIFYALAMRGNLNQADQTFAKQKEAAKVLNAVLPNNPNHPGVAHYLIHSYDYPALAELALPAARAYAKIAPDAPHALHMPSHIFTRLGLWDDSIASNIASAKSAKARADRMHPGAGSFDQLHAMDYLVYAYLQEARDASATRVLSEMATLTKLDEQQPAAAYSFAAAPQRYALERHDWKASAGIELGPAWFDWKRHPQFEAVAHYGRAIGAARAGELKIARLEIDALRRLQQQVPSAKDYDWSSAVGAQREVAEAVAGFAEGDHSAALAALRQAADHEDAIGKHAVSPGTLLPAREILGDLLLESGAHADALAAYEAALKIAPHRFNSVAGAARAAQLTGDGIKARAYYLDLVRLGEHAEAPRPELAQARAYLEKN
ncbi:MAG: repeat protein, partial [Bryobacterales bacterium]|nr:repeat protein [Bryobacterales bacterium]